MADEPTSIATSAPDKKTKSHKKHKRDREADGNDGGERKHKKSKRSANVPTTAPETPLQMNSRSPEAPALETDTKSSETKSEKKKRRRHKEDNTIEKVDENQAAQNTPAYDSLPKDKKKRERKKKHGKAEGERKKEAVPKSSVVPEVVDQEEAPECDPMDIDLAPAETSNADEFGQKPASAEYPFFTQTVSQYLPLYPSGLIEPVEGFADQHLRPLLNRYVPSFRGVLLAYRNPRVGEAPGRGSLTEESANKEVVLLESINEYAVTFGWLTVDIDLFRPTRGAWMEGTVNLQGEGHIGVVCWDMFNASIEAGRLPHGWRWVDLLSKSKGKGKRNDREKTAEEAKLPTPEPLDQPDIDSTQIHTTGYWVDDNGTRIRGGAKLYFRIKHYEVGVSGDYGYLSIEGTMLNEEEEKAKYAEETEILRRRRLRHGGVLRKEQKRLPEFSMTKFGVNETEDNEAQRAPVQWVSNDPGDDTN
ncbi:hypothetical protein F5Y04DRAFT_251258 [Hypomontagnella monticulosa]|nr:hypothetical protein F5Y04DRAFT_251258 [Hypomontagnella monticulosa]